MAEKIFITRIVPALNEILAAYKLTDQYEIDLWTADAPVPYEALIARSQGCLGVLTMLTDRVDAAYLEAVPSLRVVSQCAVGVSNIDLAAAKARSIPVGHTPGVLTDATADMAFALLMAAARNVVVGADFVRAGRWQGWSPNLLLGQEVSGATLGIIGFGRIGKAMAGRGRAFNMRVLAHRTTDEVAAQYGVIAASLEQVLEESDFVSLHTPLTPSTHGLIGARELAMMKPSAILINTARGEVVDPKALYAALKAGRPAMAALDVTSPEPIPMDDPLLTLPNCLIVPHLGTATFETRRAMTRLAVANLAAGLRGEPLLHQANP